MASLKPKNFIQLFSEMTLVLLLCVGCASAATYQMPSPLPFDPLLIHTMPEPDDGVEIQNITSYITYWNERLQWGLSENQIGNKSVELEIYANENLQRNGNYYHIKNQTEFDENVSAILNLTPDQILTFIAEDRKQLDLDHQNYHKSFFNTNPNKNRLMSDSGDMSVTSISPSSQSAPYALGRIYYVYIFTDFCSVENLQDEKL